MDSPRRSGGATRAASVAPSTVSTAKRRPRTAETAESQSSPSSAAYSGEGAPRATSPTASTGPGPNRAVSAGTADCPATVTARNTAVTRPAGLAAAGAGAWRTEMLAPLSGSVGAVGCGNGRNFARYPAAVTGVTAVEPEPHLRSLATRAAAAAPVPVTVVAGTAEALPLPDGGADAAVLCLVLCSLPDRDRALAEITRVLRPGGTLAFLEHGLGPTRRVRATPRPAHATPWPRLTAGGGREGTCPCSPSATAPRTAPA